jgi:hypothetical protein|tara:strand:- start:29 stop:280 length:252 start_codon:yes stop_codon:yes gene_type:complete
MKISKAQLRRIIREELTETNLDPHGQDVSQLRRGEIEVPGEILPLEAIGSLVRKLEARVDGLERKLEDLGGAGPGTPFEESKK